MIRRAVILAPEAREDLVKLYDRIAKAAGPVTALSYLARIEAYLMGFEIASERGSRRDDIRPGLRTVGFERRLTIAFTVEAERVTILRVFYGGMDWETILSDD